MRLPAKVILLLGRKGAPVPYTDQVLATAPFAYWPLSETSGTQATDVAGGFHGTYNNVTLNATTFPDGTAAPLFDASNERVSLPAVALDTPFNGAVGSMMCWQRVRASGVWTDGVARFSFSVGADASNRVFYSKTTVNDRLDLSYRAAGTIELHAITSFNPVTWFCSIVTWDKTADIVRFYQNGVEVATSTVLDTWAGALAAGFTAIGNFSSSGGSNFWDGYLHDCALWNRVLSPAEISTLVPASFLV